MARKIIDLDKIDPETFGLKYSFIERIDILDKLIKDKLYFEGKDTFLKNYRKKQYRDLFFDILDFEVNYLSEYKKYIEEENKVKKGHLEYAYYIQNLIEKFAFFIKEEGTKEFLEDVIKKYRSIFIIKESMSNLLEFLSIHSEDIEDEELEIWVSQIKSKYYNNSAKNDDNKIVTFSLRKVTIAASDNSKSVINFQNYNISFEIDENNNLLVSLDNNEKLDTDKIIMNFKINGELHSIELFKNEHIDGQPFDSILNKEELKLETFNNLEIEIESISTSLKENSQLIDIVKWKGKKENKVIEIDQWTEINFEKTGTRSANRSDEIPKEEISSELDLIIISKKINYENVIFKLNIEIKLEQTDFSIESYIYPIIDAYDKKFHLKGFNFDYEKQSYDGSNINFNVILSSKKNGLSFYGRENELKYPEELLKYKNLALDDYKIEINLSIL